tara:strand:+ start:275 stop:562 length:288 start_codon:yes stop_codon:yes gene_type:complete
MTSTEKAIRDFCGHHADWWPSTTQIQEILALAQTCKTCEALARTVMLDQTSHDTKRPWVGLTDEGIQTIHDTYYRRMGPQEFARAIEAKLKEKNT